MSDPTPDPVSADDTQTDDEPLAGEDALERLADKQQEADIPATPGA